VHGGSGYFDGSDYLEMSYNSAFKFAANQDFCVELWAYANASLTGNYLISQITTNNWGFVFGTGLPTNGRIGVWYGNGSTSSTQYLEDTVAFPLYQWTHVVWCRTSGTMSLFVNGTRQNTLSNTNAINLTTNRGIRIGCHQDGAPGNFWPGYISGIRSIVGNSPYDATLTTLTIPTSPAVTTANTSILLNFTNAAITDATAKNVLETADGAQIRTTINNPFGAATGTMYFDGSLDYLSAPTSTLFGFGTGDFTIEFWVYFNSTAVSTIMSHLTSGSSTRPHLYINNTIRYYTAGSDRIISSSAPSTGTWHHLAITRQSGSTKMFLNGTQTGSTYPDSNDYGQSAPLGVGTYWNNGVPDVGNNFNGYISNLRITRGVARTITTPTGAFVLR
jgi:hypothetical protein